MQKDVFEKILTFLLGASWGIVLFGALFVFKTFLAFGTFFSLFLTIFYVIFSLFFVLLLDAMLVQKKRLKEEQKQTALLEKIYNNTQK